MSNPTGLLPQLPQYNAPVEPTPTDQIIKPAEQLPPTVTPKRRSSFLSKILIYFLILVLLFASFGAGVYSSPIIFRLLNPNPEVTQTNSTPKTSQVVTCTTGIADDFASSALNTDIWSTVMNDSISQANNKLQFTVDPKTGEERNQVNVKSINQVTGDFIASLEIDGLTASTKGSGSAELGFNRGSDPGHVHIGLHDNEDGTLTIESNAKANDTWSGSVTSKIFETFPITLYIQRQSSKITTYFKTNTGLIQLGNFANAYAGEGNMFVYSISTSNDAKIVSSFSHFSLGCKNNDIQADNVSIGSACSYNLNDNFLDNKLTSLKYGENAQDGSINIANGSATLQVIPKNKVTSVNLTSNSQMNGDFTVTIDATSLSADKDRGTAEIGINTATGGAHLTWSKGKIKTFIETNANVNGKDAGSIEDDLTTLPSKVTLQVKRVGNTLNTYYKTNGMLGFKQLGTFTNFPTTPASLVIYSFSADQLPQVTSSFSNLKVTCQN